jgi:hypothetical protein
MKDGKSEKMKKLKSGKNENGKWKMDMIVHFRLEIEKFRCTF